MQSNHDETQKPNKSAPLDKQKWSALITEWEKTSESQKKFCDRLNININLFSYMRGKLALKKTAQPKLIPISIKSETNISNIDKKITLQYR